MKTVGGSFNTRERGVYGIHWINTTSGELDQTWTTADFTSVEGAQEAMWTALGANVSNEYRLVEHRWYGFGDGVTVPNPPTRVTTLGSPIVPAGSTVGPHQLATTVTLRTALRRHWGRIYLPLSPVNLAAGGQLTSAIVDTIAGAARTALLVTPSTQGILPVVYDRNRKLLFGTTALEVDSVPDIIRRRRPRDTFYKKIHTS